MTQPVILCVKPHSIKDGEGEEGMGDQERERGWKEKQRKKTGEKNIKRMKPYYKTDIISFSRRP